MKKFYDSLIAVSIVFISVMSCSKNVQDLSSEIPIQPSVISEQTALSNLDAFLGQTKSTLGTDSDRTISTYSFDGNTTDSPDLYLVNYSNENGFAILGANTSYPEILAVVDNGNIDKDLEIIHYSVPDLDPCVDATSTVQQLIDNTRDNLADNHVSFAVNEIDSAHGGSDKTFADCPRMLSYSWSQGNGQTSGLFNKYCVKDNQNWYSGCGCAAIASVIAYNHYPIMKVNNQSLDYKEMTDSCFAWRLCCNGHI